MADYSSFTHSIVYKGFLWKVTHKEALKPKQPRLNFDLDCPAHNGTLILPIELTPPIELNPTSARFYILTDSMEFNLNNPSNYDIKLIEPDTMKVIESFLSNRSNVGKMTYTSYYLIGLESHSDKPLYQLLEICDR